MTTAAESVTLSGLDFNKVYTSGTVILLNPVESNSIFIVASMLSASLEYLFEISNDVDSDYFQELLEVITEETLVFGVVQLFMVFLSSLTTLSEAWAIMFQWGQLLMIYMAFWLTVFVIFIANSNSKWREYWKQFETVRMKSSANNPDADEKLYMRCVSKFRVTMMAYGYTADQGEVNFCDYLGMIEKKQIIKLMDMSWKSWLSMVVTATVNSIRATLVSRDRNEWMGSDLLIPMVTYLLFQGFGPMLFFWYLQSALRRRLQQYLDLGSEGMEKRLQQLDYNANEPDPTRHHEVEPFETSDLQDPKSFLFWQSLDVTVTLVQVSLLQLVWFYSNAVLTTGGNGDELKTWGAIVVVLFMVVPGIFVARNMSWTVTLISILSALETAADRELIDDLLGITKEQREKEEEEKEEEEKKKKEAEEEAEREAQGLGPKAVEEFDEEGRVKVQVAPKRPVALDDDFNMSRVALDRREAMRLHEEFAGVNM